MEGTDSHVATRTPENDHKSDSDHPTHSTNTKTCDDEVRESVNSLNLLIFNSKTPIFLAVLIGLKIVFIDIFVPLGAVCSDFWQVLTNINQKYAFITNFYRKKEKQKNTCKYTLNIFRELSYYFVIISFLTE